MSGAGSIPEEIGGSIPPGRLQTRARPPAAEAPDKGRRPASSRNRQNFGRAAITTIAYKAGLVVADSQCTSSNGSKCRVRKLTRIPGVGVFGGAGDFIAVLALRDWAAAGFEGKRPSKTSEAEALLAKEDGTVWYLSGTGTPFEILDEFTAVGSGASFAEGAMAHGATALEAVRIAAGRDSGTSGPFQQMPVRLKKRRRSDEDE